MRLKKNEEEKNEDIKLYMDEKTRMYNQRISQFPTIRKRFNLRKRSMRKRHPLLYIEDDDTDEIILTKKRNIERHLENIRESRRKEKEEEKSDSEESQ